MRRVALYLLFCGTVGLIPLSVSGSLLHAQQTDLDAFMQQVLAHRDGNWKKLQQYILDEREAIELRGPNRTALWGEHREFTWYIRDGYFVRSPIKFNGAAIGEADRRKYEADYLRREQNRERRALREEPGAVAPDAPDAGANDGARDIDGLIRQTRQPQFISSAYFLRFKFEAGTYALVGREDLDGREVLKIEYYPSRLYSPQQGRRMARNHDKNDPRDAEIQRMMNKVALVTLWVEPRLHQILKYTFDNVDFDFLPGQWFLRLDGLHATMRMGEPFPDVWLPRDLELHAAVMLAAGRFDLQYSLDYHDYRQADVTSKLRIPNEH